MISEINKLPSPRLFVIGDSFSSPPRSGEVETMWTSLLVKKLSNYVGSPTPVVNGSLHGSSQVWCWGVLQQWLESCITPDDYLIVILTDPSRYWFIEDRPDLSNSHIIDLDQYVGSDVSNAIASYIQYIQRPSTDVIHLVDRLGLLAYYVTSQSLKRPIVIKAFDQEVLYANNFKELNWATGTLLKVQNNEFKNRSEHRTFWRGLDARYNHLCLSNHEILSNKIFSAIINDTAVDLTTGFIEDILDKAVLSDNEFCKKELDLYELEITLAQLNSNTAISSWREQMFTRKGK
jgi:hypothetical protein